MNRTQGIENMSVSNTWFYEANGQRTGPVSLQVIRSLSRKGIITKTTLVSDDSQDSWVPFSDVEGRFTPAAPTVATTPNPASRVAPSVAAAQSSVPTFSPAAGQLAANVSTTSGPDLQLGVTGFGQAIAVCFSKYFTFSGRANRAEYWYFYLFTVLVSLPLAFIVGFAPVVLANSMMAAVIGMVVLVLQLALFIPVLSVSVRRLHDTDKSGWWLLMALVPIVGYIVLIVFFIQRGTLVANRYG